MSTATDPILVQKYQTLKNNSIQRIAHMDHALAQYYKTMNRNDYYLNNNYRILGIGKFMMYCLQDDNEIDDQNLDHEFIDYKECLLLTFDDHFPLHSYIVTEDERQREIFRILKYYYQSNKASQTTHYQQQDTNHKHLKRIDNALAAYYSQMGRNDYYDINGKSKFIRYFEENECVEDDIDDELSDDTAFNECQYIDYLDTNPRFPLRNSKDLNDTQKQRQFFEILQHCYKYGEAPLNVTHCIHLNDIDFEPNVECIKHTKSQYKQQCPKLFSVSFPDHVFLKYLAVGQNMNHFPFLQYMTDCYARERLRYSLRINNMLDDAKIDDMDIEADDDDDCKIYRVDHVVFKRPNSIRSTNELTIFEWSQYNKYLKQFQALHPKQWIDIQSAISSYIKRICPQWLFRKRLKIRDCVYMCSEYILSADIFVSNITNHFDLNCCPFQFDFAIAVKEVQIEDNDHYTTKIKQVQKKRKYRDLIGDIHDKLRSNQCVFSSSVIIEEKASRSYYKVYNDVYQSFCDKLQEKYGDDMKYYPRKKRFCAILDRRQIYNEHDVLTMYEPPPNCNALPQRNHVPECYFDTLNTCFLPRNDYKNGVNQDMIEMTKINEKHIDKLQRSTISNISPNNEGLIFFSYHIESKDQIKCYLWWRLQCIRFLSSDLRNLLPEMFVDSYSNNSGFRNDYALINHIMKKFKCNDRYFQDWYQTITTRSAS